MYLVTNLDHNDPEAKAFIEGAFEKVKPLVFFSLSSVTMDFSKQSIVYLSYRKYRMYCRSTQ